MPSADICATQHHHVPAGAWLPPPGKAGTVSRRGLSYTCSDPVGCFARRASPYQRLKQPGLRARKSGREA
jgi:hypothetical protein